MRINNRRLKSLLLAAILLFVAFLFPLPVHADQTSALAELNSARLRLVDCYVVARAAEAQSANISKLTSTLNDAGVLFSRAEFAYSIGDFESTQNFAAQSQSLLGNFISSANSLEVEAAQRRDQDFLLNIFGSIVGAIAVLLGGFVIWVILKRKYEN
jgi:hypothetical protein